MQILDNPDCIKVGAAQIAPVWLNRKATLEKMIAYVQTAAGQECQMVVFGEALLPGYPFWIERTDGARFNSSLQKEMHAHYLRNAVQIEAGHLAPLCDAAAKHEITVIAGMIECPADRGGHSVYAALAYIDAQGKIRNVHRKLMPTYEERLTWAPGDGHGLRVQKLGGFTVGALNCWENWMPLARAALYAQGEDLHIAIWPGGVHNTADITRFIAKEARSFVVSVSGFMSKNDFPADTPYLEAILADCPPLLANGGSCIAAPTGEWLIPPVTDKEELVVATLDRQAVLEERQNFDPAGHYSRPDVTRLIVNRQRQSTLYIKEDDGLTAFRP